MASQGMVSLTMSLCVMTPRVRLKNPKTRSCHLRVLCSKLSQWEQSPFIHDSTEEAGGTVLEKTKNVFESIVSETEEDEKVVSTQQIQVFKWPIWLLGPSVLLTSGMAPTLWLPLSSVYVGSKVVSVLSINQMGQKIEATAQANESKCVEPIKSSSSTVDCSKLSIRQNQSRCTKTAHKIGMQNGFGSLTQ
ncbi:hypothetical protein N665_7383s0001, partial [Sinapis alba]